MASDSSAHVHPALAMRILHYQSDYLLSLTYGPGGRDKRFEQRKAKPLQGNTCAQLEATYCTYSLYSLYSLYLLYLLIVLTVLTVLRYLLSLP